MLSYQTKRKKYAMDGKNIRKNQALTLVRAVVAQDLLTLEIDDLGIGMCSVHIALLTQDLHQLINMTRGKNIVVVQKNAILSLRMV